MRDVNCRIGRPTVQNQSGIRMSVLVSDVLTFVIFVVSLVKTYRELREG